MAKTLNHLCDIRAMLGRKALTSKGGEAYAAYGAAADALQKLIEESPGGHAHFWTKRCPGTNGKPTI